MMIGRKYSKKEGRQRLLASSPPTSPNVDLFSHETAQPVSKSDPPPPIPPLRFAKTSPRGSSQVGPSISSPSSFGRFKNKKTSAGIRKNKEKEKVSVEAGWDEILNETDTMSSPSWPQSRKNPTRSSPSATSEVMKMGAHTMPPRSKGGKVSKLAQLFSSRAQQTPTSPPRSKPWKKAPVSPVTSTASSAMLSSASPSYVGWPGTQNKQGQVVLPDDDYVSRTSVLELDEDEEQELAATKEMDHWINGSEHNQADDPISEGSESESETENAADHHLAAALSDAARPSENIEGSASFSENNVPVHLLKTHSVESTASYAEQSSEEEKAPQQYRKKNGSISIQNLFGKPNGKTKHDPWDIDSSTMENTSEPSTSSKDYKTDDLPPGIDLTASARRVKNSGRELPFHKKSRSLDDKSKLKIQPLSEAALRQKDHLTPPPRPVNGVGFKGYRGFLDKTRDVPNLMDESDSITTGTEWKEDDSSGLKDRESDIFEGLVKKEPDSQSDIFDGLEGASQVDKNGFFEGDFGPSDIFNGTKTFTNDGQVQDFRVFDDFVPSTNRTRREPSKPKATTSDFYGRKTGIPAAIRDTHEVRKFSPRGNSSHVNANAPIVSPDFYPQTSAAQFHFSDSDVDFSKYYVQPSAVRKLVRKYRKLCRNSPPSLDSEDAKKSFALFEMRSRIMETDIERGLSRRGGAVITDDIVLTPSNLAAMRVRDAVIVSKAWRDGASPRDVITAAILTQRSAKTYKIKRTRKSLGLNCNGSVASLASVNSRWVAWEEVKWVDDSDFAQLRCPSLGPRCMRGFEMFTIGDCQSLLLKLTNERCMQLRQELNIATSHQIEAEEIMNSENDDRSVASCIMTDAELTYLASMEEVKTISKQLVRAECAFQSVRDRIERLVQKYESLLVKMDTESTGSEGSSGASDGSDEYDDFEDDREKEMLARRAQRAELKAEVAAREAMLAKEEAERIKEEKQMELEALQKRLEELESKSLIEHERKHQLAQQYDQQHRATSVTQSNITSSSKQKHNIEAKERVKAKWRSRRADKTTKRRSPSIPVKPVPARMQYESKQDERKSENWNEEEMFQHLDFYERSLQAVKSSS